MSGLSGRDFQVLREISAAVAHVRDPQRLLADALAILNRQMGMLRGTITLLHDGTLTIEASHGLDEAARRLGRYRLGEGITGHVAETGRPEIVADVRSDPRFLNRTGARAADEPVAFICVPVFAGERVIGTLGIDRRIEPGMDLRRDAALLETVGNITAGAVSALLQSEEERRALEEENRRLRDLSENPGELVGNSSAMRRVYAQIRQVAPSDATVLLRGATGTGKELAARAIVRLSARARKPFVALNCAALPEALVESELFGHERGAFTGAVARRIGRAEEADGGTLFLDEVGDLSPQTQVKLLRFLQERTFSRVGSNRELRADVRFIAATSRDLEALMREGRFREDLYYRLNIFPIHLPPLAGRRSDIVLLAEHFMAKFGLKYRKRITRLSTTAINMLMAYHWPGNVRELENGIEHAVLTSSDGAIHGYNLPPSLQTGEAAGNPLLPPRHAPLRVMVASYERELIVDALKRSGGNLSAAGRALGVSPRMMVYKIRRHGITPAWYRREGGEDGGR